MSAVARLLASGLLTNAGSWGPVVRIVRRRTEEMWGSFERERMARVE